MTIGYILDITRSIAAVVILFGFMILVHELGHYMSARLMKMRVDAFAVGFGPSIFKRRSGPTVFSLNIIPFGGYCKIAGMELDDYDARDGFNTKPAYARFAVIFAGVLMNFFTAFLLFFLLIAVWGDYRSELAVNAVFPDSPVVKQQVELHVGDIVLAVNDQEVADTYELAELLAEIPSGRETRVRVLRGGEVREVVITPEDFEPIGQIGVSTMGSVVAAVAADTPAHEAGILSGDRIVSINGEIVRSSYDIMRMTAANPGIEIQLLIRRPGAQAPEPGPVDAPDADPASPDSAPAPMDPELMEIALTPMTVTDEAFQPLGLAFRRFGFHADTVVKQELIVTTVLPGSSAERAGFRSGDELVSVDGVAVYHLVQVKELIERAFGREARILVRRDGRLESFSYEPEIDWTFKTQPLLNFERDIGFKPVRYRTGLMRALTLGYKQLRFTTQNIVGFIAKLFTREVSVQGVGGPVSVIRITASYSRQGSVDNLIWLAASLSIVLAIFNLIPFPGLDGSRILVVLIEAVTRRRINRNVEYYLHLAGFMVLMGLMLVLVYRDIVNWIMGRPIF